MRWCVVIFWERERVERERERERERKGGGRERDCMERKPLEKTVQ